MEIDLYLHQMWWALPLYDLRQDHTQALLKMMKLDMLAVQHTPETLHKKEKSCGSLQGMEPLRLVHLACLVPHLAIDIHPRHGYHQVWVLLGDCKEAI